MIHLLMLAMLAVDSVVVLPIAESYKDDLGGSGGVVLADVGAKQATGKDGCSGAYKKFKANVAKMTVLKTKAEKKKAKALKAQKKAEGLLKRCNKDHNEILAKATFKKAVMKKKVKAGAKKVIDKYKKKAKAKRKTEKKKTKAKVSGLKKKASSATRKMKIWKKKYKKTKRDLKAKYKQKIAKYKVKAKAQMKKKVKIAVADGMVRKTKEIKKAAKLAFEKKLTATGKNADQKYAKLKKSKTLKVAELQDRSKEKVGKANKAIPPPTQKELSKLKSGLKSKKTEAEKLGDNLKKTSAKLKDTKDSLGAKLTAMKIKADDCLSREKRLTKQAAKNKTQMKMDAIKMDDKNKEISRLKAKLKMMSTELEGAKAMIKAKEREKTLCKSKLKHESGAHTSLKIKMKSLRTKMSAGEGALMGELERTKKTLGEEKDRVTVLGNDLRKCRLNIKKVDRKYNRKVVKNRELGQTLYNTKRELEKFKTKLETLSMAHTTTTQRYRTVSSKLELCRDRIKDAKIKANGCQEAMRRLKTYTNDQINQQKMDLGRVRQELSQEKLKANRVQISRAEKAKANTLAKTAANKAASDAVAAANAKAVAVKADAKTAVAQAAKEAVKLTNRQAKEQKGQAEDITEEGA